MTNKPTDLVHCTNSRGISPNFGWKTRGHVQKWHLRYKTNDVFETKQSRANVTQSVCRNSFMPIDWWQIWRPRVNFGLVFRGAKFFHNGYLAHFFDGARQNLARWGSGELKVIPELSKFWFGAGPLIPCYAAMHQSFTGTLVVVFWQLPHIFG